VYIFLQYFVLLWRTDIQATLRVLPVRLPVCPSVSYGRLTDKQKGVQKKGKRLMWTP